MAKKYEDVVCNAKEAYSMSTAYKDVERYLDKAAGYIMFEVGLRCKKGLFLARISKTDILREFPKRMRCKQKDLFYRLWLTMSDLGFTVNNLDTEFVLYWDNVKEAE